MQQGAALIVASRSCLTHPPIPARHPARSCTAYPTDVCDPVQQQQQKFVLAFTVGAGGERRK